MTISPSTITAIQQAGETLRQAAAVLTEETSALAAEVTEAMAIDAFDAQTTTVSTVGRRVRAWRKPCTHLKKS